MGELEGRGDPCAAVSKELPMSNTSHMIPQMSMLGNFSFPSAVFCVIFDGGEATVGVGISAFIFVGNLELQWPCLRTAVAVFLIEYVLELVTSSAAALMAALLIVCSSIVVLMAALLIGNFSAIVLMAALLIGFLSGAILMAALLPCLGLALIVSSKIS